MLFCPLFPSDWLTCPKTTYSYLTPTFQHLSVCVSVFWQNSQMFADINEFWWCSSGKIHIHVGCWGHISQHACLSHTFPLQLINTVWSLVTSAGFSKVILILVTPVVRTGCISYLANMLWGFWKIKSSNVCFQTYILDWLQKQQNTINRDSSQKCCVDFCCNNVYIHDKHQALYLNIEQQF